MTSIIVALAVRSAVSDTRFIVRQLDDFFRRGYVKGIQAVRSGKACHQCIELYEQSLKAYQRELQDAEHTTTLADEDAKGRSSK